MTKGIDDIELDDFEKIPNFETGTPDICGEHLDQGYGMVLGERIRLTMNEMSNLKYIIDSRLSPDITAAKVTFNVDPNDISGLRIVSEKLNNIPVEIEELNGRILVKVGPCDLSGVGGHQVREQIIKNLVNQALKEKGLNVAGFYYENVNVSSCVGVRGRAQMAWGMFFNNRENAGSHMNAYVKTDKEDRLTLWEPRQGPQHWFNDTVCAMVISACTSWFEYLIRANKLDSSEQATNGILKNPSLVKVFDQLISQTENRVTYLVESITELVGADAGDLNSQSPNISRI